MSFPSLLQGKIKILEVAFEKSCQAPRLTSFKDIFLFRAPLRGGKKSVILENVSITTNSVDAPEQKRASDMYQPGHWHRGSCWSQAPAKISVAMLWVAALWGLTALLREASSSTCLGCLASAPCTRFVMTRSPVLKTSSHRHHPGS